MSIDPAVIAAAQWLKLDALPDAVEPPEDDSGPPTVDADSAGAAPTEDQAPPSADSWSKFAALSGWLPAAQHAAAAQHSADAGAASRQELAQKLAAEGGLKSPGPNPPPLQKELDDLAAAINAADDDAAVRIANNPRAMELATPQQKAALVKKLMNGHTSGAEEQAIKRILLSCKSFEEMEQVVQMSGGIQAIADELDKGDLQAVIGHANQLAQKQEAAVSRAIDLLEQAANPEEFRRLYDELGGESLKHKLPKGGQHNDLSARLDALGQKHGVGGVGFGVPPEKVAAYQAALQKAIAEKDNDAIVKLSENGEAMKVASPAQKARMIAILQEGWTKDSQDMAIARILTSCGSKAEFDQVVDMAGGPKILQDVDLPAAKADINRMMGGFDRIDCADDKATAQAHRGTMMPPLIDELTRTRPASEAERRKVLGPSPYSAQDRNNPALADATQRMDAVRAKMGNAAYDLPADPLARNKLVMTNRDRQLNGQPPLDHTALVTKAYEVANDPAFLADVDRTIAAAEKDKGKLDDEQKQEIREKALAQRLGAVAKEYGLSEQDMKTLVTAKMGRVLQEGAGAVAAIGGETIQSLQLQLIEVERTAGPDSPEAKRLRDTIDKFGRETGAWANRLQVTGATAARLFKVPPSFAEDFVKALSVVGDVLAAVVNVIPGVGQAISGAYFGVKAIVGLATGDVLGAFKSLLSAVPGFSGVFGAASAAINTGARVVQTGIAAGEGIANGNPLAFAGALGSMAGNFGVDLGKYVPAGEFVQGAMKHGAAVGGMVDGAIRGDFGSVFGAALPGELRAVGAGALADRLEALGASSEAQAFRRTSERVGQFLGAVAQNDPVMVGEALRLWMPELSTHDVSGSITGLADQARGLMSSRELASALQSAGSVRLKALDAQQCLERMAALTTQAAEIRRFEDAVDRLLGRSQVDWPALGAEFLRRFGLR